MKNIKRMVLLAAMCASVPQEGSCTKLSAIRDAVDEVLYGSQPISSRLVEKSLKDINQPEINSFCKVETRKREKAISIVQEKKESLRKDISSDSESSSSSEGENHQAVRLHQLLSVLDYSSDLDPVPLSFLLEEVCAQYH
jgi:hypothetical protein